MTKAPTTLAEEALEFVSKRNKDSEIELTSDKLLVAVILAGLLARGPSSRAEELLDEARKYLKLLKTI